MRIGLHALMLIKDIVFFKLSSAKTLCFSSCLFKAPPPVYYQTQYTADNNRVAVLSLRTKLTKGHILCKRSWLWSVMSQSHWIKGGTTDKAFQVWHFLQEGRASVGANFDLF